MVTIAVDAMGGDHAPRYEVDGAIQAARCLGVRVILVGREEVVRSELMRHGDAVAELGDLISVQHASEQITMEDSAAKAVEALTALTESSKLGGAIRQVLKDFRGASLSGVVMLTDGVTTEGDRQVLGSRPRRQVVRRTE